MSFADCPPVSFVFGEVEAYLIFVTSTTCNRSCGIFGENLSCGEISDFYVYMKHVEKSEISPHVKEFQISPQNRFVSVLLQKSGLLLLCEENFSNNLCEKKRC